MLVSLPYYILIRGVRCSVYSHIHAEMKEIEAKVRLSDWGSSPRGKSTIESFIRKGEGENHTLESLGTTTTSPRLHASVEPNKTAYLNSFSNSGYNTTHAPGGGVQVTNAAVKTQTNLRHSAANVDSTQTSSRSSQRIAARRSQRNVGTSSIAVVAAAAAQVEASTSAIQLSTSTLRQGSAPVLPDVKMTDGTMPTQVTESTSQITNSSSTFSQPPKTVYSTVTTSPIANFEQAPSMESIVRVAEAAIAAQNAAKSTVQSTPSNTAVDPNLDPSLLSETSNLSSTTAAEVPGLETTGNVHEPTTADTNSANASTNTSVSIATPASISPTSSNLSNNPYLPLVTNYQRHSLASPTGQPMYLPFPLLYTPPGPSIAPNAPGTYPISYNPYYYLAPPIVPGSNGVYPPIPVPPPPQQTQQPTPPQQDQQRVKPKRLKSHAVTTKSFSIPMVPRDKLGKPMLPLNVGIMTVINLGTVCMRDHFHTERYIFPVGYEVTR